MLISLTSTQLAQTVILVCVCDLCLVFLWYAVMRAYQGIACTGELLRVRGCAPHGDLTLSNKDIFPGFENISKVIRYKN